MEINFDGIVGTTHHYGGLSYGNIASTKSEQLTSNPKKAALQGLRKMKFLADRGIGQAVLPPHERPDIAELRQIGFYGNEEQVLTAARSEHPRLLSLEASASAMWTANAATVSPSADTNDRKLHFTPANLISKVHRTLEPPTTTRILKKVFSDPAHFIVHDPLPASVAFSDEGAANHGRLCPRSDAPAIEVFVYGTEYIEPASRQPAKFPARQTKEACRAIARRHGIPTERMVITQQHPDAIDAGVFHNDVISVCHENVFFYHERAFLDTEATVTELQEKYLALTGTPLCCIPVTTEQLSLEEAVVSYLFNSQIVTDTDGSMLLLAPTECQETPAAAAVIDAVLSGDNPISAVHYITLRQSMRNGGGPACLRLRVVMTPEQRAAVRCNVFLDDALYRTLEEWIERHYRDTLTAGDLGSLELLHETRAALEELTQILELGPIYPFQRETSR